MAPLPALTPAAAATWIVAAGSIACILAHAVLIGVDLGPNVSVTGSLATIR